MANGTYETVKIERDNGPNAGLSWVILNRPEKRNAMSPQLHFDMCNVLDELESDAQTKVLVLTGAGEAWCAGQDLKLYFRELDSKPAERAHAAWASHYWRWQKLFTYPKPTIAMVNGFCFGGGFTQLIACDFAIAAEDAKFGLSEVNWGILPGGFVSKALTDALPLRDAVWLAMTGETFDGKIAEKIRLVNKAVPREKLREETIALAQRLLKLNPEVLRATKIAVKNVRAVPHEQAADYLQAKSQEMRFQDKEGGRAKGMSQFLDDKSYRPGYGPYARQGEQKAWSPFPGRGAAADPGRALAPLCIAPGSRFAQPRLQALPRRLSVDGERMHAALQLARKCGVDHAVALEPALSAEGLRHDIEPEMGLAARAVSGMAFMQMGFVLDMQARGRKHREQFCRDDVLHSHGLSLSYAEALTSMAPSRGFAACQVLKVPSRQPHNCKDEYELAAV
jgi:feruloyl-CoA hydratase/lyase